MPPPDTVAPAEPASVALQQPVPVLVPVLAPVPTPLYALAD